ncbi:MAG: GLPGLI family protein [Muribaculaceae bacterium]|nr:GLPGLI family protein [Muribaculaceae bacterium]
MSRFLFFLTAIIATISVMAEKADIKVEYSYNQRGNINNFILRASSSHSKYCDQKSEWYDSIRSTPEGMAQWQQLFKAESEYVRSNGGMAILDSSVTYPGTGLYVVKNDSVITLYDVVNIDKYYYDEPRATIKWKISDDTKDILGYQCVKATGKYHGRKWEVWFTPEIPISDGPWKLCGLPGLILYAEDKDNEFIFEAIGIETNIQEITPVYGAEVYEKIKRKDMLRAKRKHVDNPMASYQAATGSTLPLPKGVHFGTPEKKNGLPKKDFIETDYHY